MIIKKYTLGQFMQRFDSETKELLDQEFIADGIVEFENEDGEEIILEDEAFEHPFAT